MARRDYGTPKYPHLSECFSCRYIGTVDPVMDGDEPYDVWVCGKLVELITEGGTIIRATHIRNDGTEEIYLDDRDEFTRLPIKDDPFFSGVLDRLVEEGYVKA